MNFKKTTLLVVRDLPPFKFDAPDIWTDGFSANMTPTEATMILSNANEQTTRQAIKAMESVNLEFL